MPPDRRSVYRLDIQDDNRGASSPEINRLRIILKHMLRQYGFRCIRVEEIKQAEDLQTEHATGADEKDP